MEKIAPPPEKPNCTTCAHRFTIDFKDEQGFDRMQYECWYNPPIPLPQFNNVGQIVAVHPLSPPVGPKRVCAHHAPGPGHQNVSIVVVPAIDLTNGMKRH